MNIKFLTIFILFANLLEAARFQRTLDGLLYKIHTYKNGAEVEVYNSQGDEIRSYTVDLKIQRTIQDPHQIKVFDQEGTRYANPDEFNLLRDIIN